MSVSVEDELRAARETIAALRRQLGRDAALLDPSKSATQVTISSLEQVVERQTEALRQSEAHYRALFDHNPNMAFVVDGEGVIMRANAGAERQLAEYAPLVGRDLGTCFPAEVRGRLAKLSTQRQGVLHEQPMRFADADHFVDIDLSLVPGYDHLQVVIRDVTSRVELARELQQSRRLAAVGQLATGVAHEINNPLAVLQLGLAELLDEQGPEGASRTPNDRPTRQRTRRARLQELIAHGERIARIVANLDTFADPKPAQIIRLSLRELIAGARDLAGRGLAGVEIYIDLEPEEIALRGDRQQLEQALVNLMVNAAQAMAGLRSRTLSLRGRVRDGKVRLVLDDDGPGLSTAVRDQLFAPFAGGAQAGLGPGVGLGLAVVWSLIHQNGGSIRASNRGGGGARFEIELPAAPILQDGDLDPTRPRAVAPRGLKILCVEDEAGLRRSLLRLLEFSGHRPMGVESAEEALDVLSREGFDLVISDIRLPGMDGERLRDEIGRRHPQLRRRVLLMSGFFRPDTPHFLQKPFTVQQLRSAIHAVDAAAQL